MDFGFPEDKIPGTFRTNCPGWKVNIKGAKCKIYWALRLADGFCPYQLTADVGFLKIKEVVASQKSEVRGQRSEVRIENCSAFCILHSVFCLLSSASVCSQSIISNYFNFFKGGLLCVRN